MTVVVVPPAVNDRAWREFPGDPGYLVSETGDVKGPRGWVLSPEMINGGYLRVRIRQRHILVHRMVVETFIGAIPAGMEVNHKDGDKTNNRVGNLEVVTPRQNVRHSVDVLRTSRAPGVQNANAKLADPDVVEMRRRRREGESISSIAARFDIDYSHAWRIVTRRSWRHI